MPFEPVPSSVALVAHNLRVDATTAEVVAALRNVGIESVLLKGPSLGHWLGRDGVRPYLDSDLLVPSDKLTRAEEVLRGLGFSRYLEGVDLEWRWTHPAWVWLRDRGRAQVDLHRSVAGAAAPDERVWSTLSERAVPIPLGPEDVEVPDAAATAALLALHAAQHGVSSAKTIRDLEVALVRFSDDVWQEATTVAGALEALPAFVAGLRLVPRGAELVEELELPGVGPATVLLAAGSAPDPARSLEQLATLPGVAPKLRFVGRRLVPPVSWIREFSPLAEHGRLGVAAAYATRPFLLVAKTLRALPAWRSARRQADADTKA